MNFDFNLSLVLGHTLLLEEKSKINEPNNEIHFLNGGDPPAPTTSESTAEIMKNYIQYFPQLSQVTNEQKGPTQQAEAAANLATYSQYGLPLAKIGSDIDAQQRLAASNADLAILEGPGAQLAQAAKGIDVGINPEFYSGRAGLSELLQNELNPNAGINPAAERAINYENIRSGNLNVPSATNTVSNAMAFGNDKLARINSITNSLNNATSFLANTRASFDPFGRPLNSAQGSNAFAGNQSAAGNTQGLGTSFLGGITSLRQQQNDINAQRRDPLDRTTQVLGSLPNIS